MDDVQYSGARHRAMAALKCIEKYCVFCEWLVGPNAASRYYPCGSVLAAKMVRKFSDTADLLF